MAVCRCASLVYLGFRSPFTTPAPQDPCANFVYRARYGFYDPAKPPVHHMDIQNKRYSLRITVAGDTSFALQPNRNVHTLHRVADFEFAT